MTETRWAAPLLLLLLLIPLLLPPPGPRPRAAAPPPAVNFSISAAGGAAWRRAAAKNVFLVTPQPHLGTRVHQLLVLLGSTAADQRPAVMGVARGGADPYAVDKRRFVVQQAAGVGAAVLYTRRVTKLTLSFLGTKLRRRR